MKINEINSTKFENVLTLIENDCSIFIRDTGKLRLKMYHGFVDEKPEIFSDVPRDDRQPRSSSMNVQTQIDNMLKLSGFEARRGNSLFCTGNSKMSALYGKNYLIFPVNGYKFTWNELIIDMYGNLEGMNILTDIYNKVSPRVIVNKFKFRKDDISAALISGVEIYLRG